MQNILPFLWFNNNAEDAILTYTSIFPHGRIGRKQYYDAASAAVSGQQEGTLLSCDFTLNGQSFGALNGGPLFQFTPAISFFVGCDTPEEVDHLWNGLSEGGKVLMEIGSYPFSQRYGWIQDRFGVSWQLFCGQHVQYISPALLFVGQQHGHAEEAMKRYTQFFKDADIHLVDRYPAGGMDPEGTIRHAQFRLLGQNFVCMDSAYAHEFAFSQATSFMISCNTQDEIDRYWDFFADGGEIQECGWVKDRYGIAWQVVPHILNTYLQDNDPQKAGRVMKAMLGMKKLVIAELQAAYGQES